MFLKWFDIHRYLWRNENDFLDHFDWHINDVGCLAFLSDDLSCGKLRRTLEENGVYGSYSKEYLRQLCVERFLICLTKHLFSHSAVSFFNTRAEGEIMCNYSKRAYTGGCDEILQGLHEVRLENGINNTVSLIRQKLLNCKSDTKKHRMTYHQYFPLTIKPTVLSLGNFHRHRESDTRCALVYNYICNTVLKCMFWIQNAAWC